MTTEKKKRVVRVVEIVVALVLAMGAIAFSIWRTVETIKKRNSSEEVQTSSSFVSAVKDIAIDTTTADSTTQTAPILSDQIKVKIVDSATLKYEIYVDTEEYGLYYITYNNTRYQVNDFSYMPSYQETLYFVSTVSGYYETATNTYAVPSYSDSLWNCCINESDYCTQFSLLSSVYSGGFNNNGYCSSGELLSSYQDPKNLYCVVVLPCYQENGNGAVQYFYSNIIRLSDCSFVGTSSTTVDKETIIAEYKESDEYKTALTAEYDKGYSAGYAYGNDLGRTSATEEMQEKYKYYYSSEDYKDAVEDSYLNGYNKGVSDTQSSVNTGKNLILSILDAPFTLIKNIFNFEILGINISSVIFFILSVLLIAFVIRKIKG